MRLLRYDDRGELSLTRDLSDNETPEYAILSHTWGDTQDEVSFQELETGPDKSKPGYKKLQLCGEQAKRDGLDHFWVDTCCINKMHGPELSENINLMFRYYRKSKKCYVYLSDVIHKDSEKEFRESRWFKRGWTLQELLAPTSMQFFSSAWEYLGGMAELEQWLHDTTQIPLDALRGADLSRFNRHERMGCISGRQTKKEEDRAYCLLGIFGVSLVVNYGEGEAEGFSRLEDQIRRKSRHKWQVATVQNIDERIRNYYLSDGRLDIERLSGQRLPMDSCFINLAIINRPRDGDESRDIIRQETNGFTLAARLKVEIDHSKAVFLEALFQPQKLVHGTTSRPKRVMIWGRAGMGKTTLCKKIIHEFLQKGLWKDLYDRIFWLPLRRLRLTRSELKRIAELVREINFHGADDGLLPNDVLDDILQEHNDRCLFVLDGLDEVSHIDHDSPLGANLYKLLKRENVVITSRPHSSSILSRVKPDLDFETVGFFPEQVEEFLHRETDPETMAAIQSFIKSRPIVQSLVRIPIQLDAICYAWDQDNFQQDEMTMTLLYQAIVLRLWQKDVVRLGKKFDGESVTPQQIRNSRNIEYFVKSESSCLEELAFAGLYNQLTEFDAENINDIAGGREPLLNTRLCELSFLRSSEKLSIYQTYHFVHLTFQEFFAARYFVRYWSSDEVMVFPKMISTGPQRFQSTERITPVEFLHKEKYSTRYDIFWRFVTGLLQMEMGNEALVRFFGEMETEPRDRLGVAHQLLIVHCLHEVLDDQGCFRANVQKLQRGYQEWTVFESGLCRSQKLLEMAECPSSVLEHWLGRSDVEKLHAVKALTRKSNVSSQVLQAVVEVVEGVRDTTPQDVLIYALAVIAMHCNRLPGELVSRLCAAHDIREWSEACQLIPLGQTMGQHLLQSFIGYLQDENSESRHEAASALVYQSSLPSSAVKALSKLVQDSSTDVRWMAANALGSQISLPVSVVETLVQLVHDRDTDVRSSAVEALESQSNLPASAVEVLVELLQEQDSDVRGRAIQVLGSQISLPVSVVEALVVHLVQDQDTNVRSLAASALRNQTSLPESVVGVLVQLFRDQDIDIRSSAIEALRFRTSLPVTAVKALVQLLQDPDPVVRWRAARNLGSQISLPSSAVEALVVHLVQDQDTDIRQLASYTLRSQMSLSVMAVKALVQLLQDPDPVVRGRAARNLGSQISLPSSAVEALVVQLSHDQDTAARWWAVWALKSQTQLPAFAIEAVIQLLQERHSIVRDEAVVTLRNLPTISQSHLKLLNQLLESERTTEPAAQVLNFRAEFYESLATLDSIPLANILRYWFKQCIKRGSYSYAVFNGNILAIEIDGKRWSVSFSSGERETFEQRWLDAQKSIGVPLIHDGYNTLRGPHKRERSCEGMGENEDTRGEYLRRKV